MKFLKNYTVDLKALPQYSKFNGIFNEDLDRNLLELLLKSNDYSINTNTLLQTAILGKLRNDNTHIHTTQYRQSYGLGRFYGNTITNFQKRIKHTLFSHLGWCDADMVKGHPTLILQLAKINGDIDKYPSISEYVKNPTKQFDEMTAHYGKDLLEHQKKWLFNSMIYGGGHQGWVDALTDPPDKELQRGYIATPLLTQEPRPFEVQFKKECDMIKEVVYKNNPALIELLKGENKNKKYFKEKGIDTNDEDDAGKVDKKQTEETFILPLHKMKNKVISYFLQILENECLYHLYEYLIKESIILPKHCSLEKDGICFPPNKKFDNDDLADSVNEYTYKKTGFRIKWKIKPYEAENIDTQLIDIRKTYCPDKAENTSLSFNDEDEKYEAIKKEFEATHFKIKDCDQYIITDGRNVKFDKERVVVASNRHLCYGFATKNTDVGKVIDKSSPLSFIDRWIRDEHIKIYDGAGFYPPPTPLPENHFNLWTPFPYQDLYDEYEKDEEGLRLILGFIKILCKNDDAVCDFFIKWLAQLLQYPASKTGHFPIFISEEGVGKGTLLLIIKKLIGEDKYLEATNPEETVWGNFNPLMLNAYFVHINEFGKKNQEDADGRIKGLLTDEELSINCKGKDPFKIKSYHRFLGSTNNEDPTTVKNGGRRKWLIRCSDELKGNKFAFNKMYELMDKTLTVRTLFNYLMAIKCDDLRGQDPPKTEYQEDLEESNEHIIQQFIKWGAGDIDYHKGDIDKQTDETTIITYTSNHLYDKFKRFKAFKHYHNYETSSPALMKKINTYKASIPKEIIEKHRTKKGVYTIINWDAVNKHFGLGFEENEEEHTDDEEE